MTFSGPSYRTICQADGRWSHPIPRCYGQSLPQNFVHDLLLLFFSSVCGSAHHAWLCGGLGQRVIHGYREKGKCERIIAFFPGHNQSISVRCLSQFQPTTNLTTSCNNGTWSKVPKCIPAKCTELPDAPRNGMVSKQASCKSLEIMNHG